MAVELKSKSLMLTEPQPSRAWNDMTKMKSVSPIKPRFRKVSKIGGGTYGRVYQAILDRGSSSNWEPGQLVFVSDSVTGQLTLEPEEDYVAIKRNFITPSLKESIGSLRELDILNLVKGHPYCVELKDVCYESPFVEGSLSPADKDWVSDKAYFVMEKGQLDGDKYIRSSSPPLVNDRKMFATHIFLAVEFLHSRGVYHRDLKPANVICFLNDRQELQSAKLTDFGLSQYYCCQSISVQGFVTLWYRAPEISLGRDYDYKVDVWSLGCILFELFSSGHRRFMQPTTDAALLNSLIELLEVPVETYLLAQQLYGKKMTRYYEALQQMRRPMEALLGCTESQIAQFNSAQLAGRPNFGTYAELLDLLEKILVVDPDRRWTVSRCLNHPFFDGVRDLIDRTRSQFGINRTGEWVLAPPPQLLYRASPARARGMGWFQIIYANRMNLPIANWYSHQILYHAIEMFDRYLTLTNQEEASESDIVVWVNTFSFMATKYFRVLVTEFGLMFFTLGIKNEEFYIFRSMAQNFEEHVVRDVFKGTIYQPTLYETANDFLTENSIAHLFRLIVRGEVPTGTTLQSIWISQYPVLVDLNRDKSPVASSGTPVISLSSH